MPPAVNIDAPPARYVDFSDAAAKAAFVRQVQSLSGQYRVSITKRQRRRSLEQNAYYWSVVLPVVVEGFAAEWGEAITIWQAHETMKHNFLSRRVGAFTVPLHGKASSTGLSVQEFSEYIEKISQLVAEMFGLSVPSAASAF